MHFEPDLVQRVHHCLASLSIMKPRSLWFHANYKSIFCFFLRTYDHAERHCVCNGITEEEQKGPVQFPVGCAMRIWVCTVPWRPIEFKGTTRTFSMPTVGLNSSLIQTSNTSRFARGVQLITSFSGRKEFHGTSFISPLNLFEENFRRKQILFLARDGGGKVRQA